MVVHISHLFFLDLGDDRCWITQSDGFIQFWEEKRAVFLRRQDELAVRIKGCKDRLQLN